MKKQIKIKPGIRLTPPQYFEGSDYVLSFTFRQMTDLKGMKDEFERLSQDIYMKQFFETHCQTEELNRSMS